MFSAGDYEASLILILYKDINLYITNNILNVHLLKCDAVQFGRQVDKFGREQDPPKARIYIQTTRCYTPEDRNLDTHRCENLSSHMCRRDRNHLMGFVLYSAR
jgi:hypothetical protein